MAYCPDAEDQPLPSAPPLSSAQPPPFNPSYPPRQLQPQTSLPAMSYREPQQYPQQPHRGSQVFQPPPPYSPTQTNPQSSSYQQPPQGNWGHRLSYPSTMSDQQMYASLPRPPPAPTSEWGGSVPRQGYVPAQPQAVAAAPQQSYYSSQPAQFTRVQIQTTSPLVPTGYNVMDLFVSGNILFLIPETSPNKLPIKTSWGSVEGGGMYTEDDSKFEVVVPRQDPVDWVVMLRNYANKDRYICINRKGQIKACKGVKETCEFHIRPVGSLQSSTVCFESAVNPGWFIGMTSSGTFPNINKLSATSPQTHFRIRAHRILNNYNASMPLRVFGRVSVLNQLKDRCVVQLRSKSSRKFLGIDVKGRVMENHDMSDQLILFLVFDRGIGVVSLRSYKHAGYWLRVENAKLQGKGLANLAADFQLKENHDGTVCLESVSCPGVFVVPPIARKQSTPVPPPSTDFTLTTVNLL